MQLTQQQKIGFLILNKFSFMKVKNNVFKNSNF